MKILRKTKNFKNKLQFLSILIFLSQLTTFYAMQRGILYLNLFKTLQRKICVLTFLLFVIRILIRL